MVKYLSTIVLLVVVSTTSPASAQSFEIDVTANAKNVQMCSPGDGTWARKWHAEIHGDRATVSVSTKIGLKKASAGIYETILSFGSSGTFTITLNVTEHSLKIVNKAYGCIWEGKS